MISSAALSLPLLQGVDVVVDRGVEGGQQVAGSRHGDGDIASYDRLPDTGDVMEPTRPTGENLTREYVTSVSIYLSLTSSSTLCTNSYIFGIHFTAWQMMKTERYQCIGSREAQSYPQLFQGKSWSGGSLSSS